MRQPLQMAHWACNWWCFFVVIDCNLSLVYAYSRHVLGRCLAMLSSTVSGFPVFPPDGETRPPPSYPGTGPQNRSPLGVMPSGPALGGFRPPQPGQIRPGMRVISNSQYMLAIRFAIKLRNTLFVLVPLVCFMIPNVIVKRKSIIMIDCLDVVLLFSCVSYCHVAAMLNHKKRFLKKYNFPRIFQKKYSETSL